MYDVAVIGAGPAGSRVACKLAEYGYRVAVIDKKTDLREPVCCTGIVSSECVRDFAIPARIVYREAKGAAVYSPSGIILRVERTEPQAYIVDRAALNVFLSEQALKQGVEYVLSRHVSEVTRMPDKVVIKSSSEKFKPLVVESRVVVIAAGAGSVLNEQVGLKTAGDFAMGAQVEIETHGVEEVEVFTGRNIAPGFFAWLVPTTPECGLVGLITRRRTGYYMKKLLALLVEQGRILPVKRDLRFARLSLNMATRTSSDRVLAVGSAAGQVKPATGGGIYYCLICADIAADNLHRALEHDNLTAGSLASYDRQWKKVLGREIRLSYWGRIFYERLNDNRIDNIFDIIVSSGIDKALLNNDNIRFDSHGSVIRQLVGHKVLTKTIKAVRLPFPLRKR